MDGINNESELTDPVSSFVCDWKPTNNSEIINQDITKNDTILCGASQEQVIDNFNSCIMSTAHDPDNIIPLTNSENVDLTHKEKIQQNQDFDNPLGLFEEESCEEPPSQIVERDGEAEDDEEMFFVFEDESQDATNGNDSKLIDLDSSKADVSETSNLEAPLSDGGLRGNLSWRGRRKFRGSKVPLSVINRKYKKKVGEAIANKEKEEKTGNYQLFEYYWPPGKSADLYMIQEAVSEYLSVVSFQRKYPELKRRPIDVKEREFLKEQLLVTDFQCDLGLTVLLADEVYDLMEEDFPQFYMEYLKKPRRRYRYVEKPVDPVLAEKLRKEHMLRKAIESASVYNSNLLKERKTERQTYLDLQTFTIHGKRKPQNVGVNPYENLTNYYPVILIPGQFQHFYKEYTPNELNYLPINTALFTTHKRLTTNPDDYQDSDPDDPFPHPHSQADTNPTDHVRNENLQLPVTPQKFVAGETQADTIKDTVKDNDIKTDLVTHDVDVKGNKNTDAPELDSFLDLEVGEKEGSEINETTPKKRKVFKRKTISKSCSFCGQFQLNKKDEPDDLIRCSTCRLYNHPGCLELNSIMIPSIRKYAWQCMDCKICCHCKEPHDEDKMMFCDMCDRGYHTYCVGLETIPEGQWQCSMCSNPNQPVKPKRGRPCKNRPLISTAPTESVNHSNDSLIVNASQSDMASLLQDDQKVEMEDLIKTDTSQENSDLMDQSHEKLAQMDQSQESLAKMDQSQESLVQIDQPQESIAQMDQSEESLAQMDQS